LKNYFKYFLLLILFLFACNAAEELLQTKKAPNVSAIQSDKGFNVNPGDTVSFSVSATNPEEGDLSYEWTSEAGTYLGSCRESLVLWKAPISGGKYWIKVDVSNNHKTTSKSDEIEVISPDDPYVNIILPQSNDYLVQGSSVDIQFEAIHSNGISEVFIEVNDSTIFSRPGQQQNNYSFLWNVSGPAGEAEFKIIARSNITDKIGLDSIFVTIEGIIPGKSGD
jgi:hypothetical protein